MVALPKLQSYGIAEDDILNLNSFFERIMMNNKMYVESIVLTLSVIIDLTSIH
jgi:hypothetical protein